MSNGWLDIVGVGINSGWSYSCILEEKKKEKMATKRKLLANTYTREGDNKINITASIIIVR